MSTKFTLGMRDAFFEALFPLFRRNKRAVLVSADNGAPSLDRFVRELPGQYFNVGIAEQQMMGFACGLALEGRKVYTYAIAPFVTLRCYEQNKLDQCAMNLPIVNLGVGAGYAYDIMGPSHHTVEDISIMRALPNVVIHSPADGTTAAALAELTFDDARPQYVRFDRNGIPEVYANRVQLNVEDGVIVTRPGRDIAIVTTGVMVHQALLVAERLAAAHVDAAVIDVCRLKPVNVPLLLNHVARMRRIVTLEEHLLMGGLGSIVAEIAVDEDVRTPILRIGQDDRFVFDNGGREVIWSRYGLAAEQVSTRVLEWIGDLDSSRNTRALHQIAAPPTSGGY
jgi:transketolase